MNVALLVAGQFFFRAGVEGKTFNSFIEIVQVIFTPMILLGLVMYGLSTFLWLYILSRIPISLAYPIMALGYPTVLILARILYQEDVSPIRWVGAAVICIGVVLIAQ